MPTRTPETRNLLFKVLLGTFLTTAVLTHGPLKGTCPAKQDGGRRERDAGGTAGDSFRRNIVHDLPFAHSADGRDQPELLVEERKEFRDTLTTEPWPVHDRLGVSRFGTDASSHLRDDPETASEYLRREFLLRLFHQSGDFPGLYLSGHAGPFAQGDGQEVMEAGLGLIAARSIRGDSVQSLHLDLTWKFDGDSGEKEGKDNRYIAVIGYDHRIGPDAMLVLDFSHERDATGEDSINGMELGFRYNLSPLTVLSLGGSAGLSEITPEFKALFRFDHSF